MTAVLFTLCALWFAAVWSLVYAMDREETARMKAAKKIRPLTQDEEAAQGIYRKEDRDKAKAMRSTRYADQQLWEMRRHEAEHIRNIRNRPALGRNDHHRGERMSTEPKPVPPMPDFDVWFKGQFGNREFVGSPIDAEVEEVIADGRRAQAELSDQLGERGVNLKMAWGLAHQKAEREADMLVGPGSGPLARSAIVARLERIYFQQYTQP